MLAAIETSYQPNIAPGLIRLRPKNQITLPREVVASLAVNELGALTYTILQDGVLIRSAAPRQESKLDKIERLANLTQTGVKSVHKNAKAIDAYVRSLRDEWA